MAQPPKPAARRGPGLFGGLWLLVRGAALLISSPGLWRWIAAPILMTIVILGAAAWGVNSWLLGWVEAWLNPRQSTMGAVFYWPLAVIAWALSLAAAYLVFATLRQVFASPFNDRLALAVEKVQRERLAGACAPVRGEAAGEGLARGAARAVANAARLLAAEYGAYLIVLPLLLVPFAGAAAFWVVRSLFAGINALDVILACHGFTHPQKKLIFHANRACLFGLGSGMTLLDMTIVLALISTQASAVAGTLLYLDLERRGRLPLPSATPQDTSAPRR
ncbi:MAG TPA: EI24 domain-containing protein [Candidatus Brocadiia bacterium]|nr:EI24 domain-containing protein [Candidatus Brocadiia bacterium]